MKKYLQTVSLVLLFTASFSQTATSIANGNWTNPLTWNCTCVPVNGYSVTISNSVTLNTSLLFTSGGININNTGSLIQDASLNRDIWINGGYFNNSGKANFRYFLISTGTITNPGTFTVSALTHSVSFNNTGAITMDSMVIAGSFTNAANAKLTGDSMTNTSPVLNNGRINIQWVTNKSTFRNNDYQTGYAFTNMGTYDNYDSLMLNYCFWNQTVFNNNAGANFNMNRNFYNSKPVAKTAVFNNNGNVNILDSWYNADTVKGSATGYFSVQDTSANSGYMKGNFKFCDWTPPAISPYVDLNSGSISAGITYCGALGIKENTLNQFSIYPNPSTGKLFLKPSDANSDNLKVSIEDVNGKLLFESVITPQSQITEINLDQKSGIYFIKILNTQNNKLSVQKLIIQK